MYGKRRKDEIHFGEKVANDLASALNVAKVILDAEVQEKLIQYMELMVRWNRAYNLTSVRDPQQIIARHIMDSLSVLPFIHGANILDVGTGAGLPGIPLALACPDSEFVLLDSNGKKCRFLIQVINELGIDNASVTKTRVEEFQPGYRFDVIISRAFSSIRDMVLLSEHLCAKDGEFLSMKGIYPAAEMVDIPPGFVVSGEHELHVSGLDAQRHLVCLKFADAE